MAFWQRTRFYLLGLALVGVSLAIKLIFRESLGQGFPFLLFIGAAMVAAWFGGLGPGLMTTAAAAICVLYFFIPPYNSFAIGHVRDLLPLVLFVIECSAIAALTALRHDAIREVAAQKANLESTVQQRTAELQNLNRELHRYTAQLQVSNRELQDFASVASHDLQEPLRKIRAFGDRLRIKTQGQLGEEALDFLSRMQSAAERMQILINDLLTFARISTRGQPFELVDLAKIAHEVVDDLETRIEQSGGKVDVGNLPTVEADATQMRQVFQNLLANALKFRKPDQPPIVRLDSRLISAPKEAHSPSLDGHFYELIIADNGIGFGQQYAERIFAVFQRLHGRGEYEGTGIGLAVCRKIIERHGGSISATSSPGAGATFTIRLPAHQCKGDAPK